MLRASLLPHSRHEKRSPRRVAWTAKGLAADRRATIVEDADVRAAIRLIDRTLGQLTTSSPLRKQATAFEWVMQETDLVACAMKEIVR